MAEVKWIKIVTDIFDDEKMLLIDSYPERDAIIVIWFKLLCLAGKQNNGGIFMINNKIAYTDEMIAVIFRRPINTIRLALKVFEQYGMIEIVDNIITIPNWDKHQNIDGMEKLREYNRQAQQKHRQKMKELTVNDKSMTESKNVNDSQGTDKNREDIDNIYRTTNVVLPHPSPAEDEFEVVEEEDDLPFEEEKAEAKSPLSKTQQKRFDSFWNAYPKKVAKQDALKAWKKISPDDELTNQILVGLENSKQHDSRFKDPQYIPYPASWLNSGCWEDEFSDEVVFSDEKPKKAQPQTKPAQKNYQFGNGNSSFDAEEMLEDAIKRTRRKMKHDRDNDT